MDSISTLSIELLKKFIYKLLHNLKCETTEKGFTKREFGSSNSKKTGYSPLNFKISKNLRTRQTDRRIRFRNVHALKDLLNNI